jgi:hypothetical protein
MRTPTKSEKAGTNKLDSKLSRRVWLASDKVERVDVKVENVIQSLMRMMEINSVQTMPLN